MNDRLQPPTPAHAAMRTMTRAWMDLFDGVVAPELGLSHQPLGRGHLLAASGVDHLLLNRFVVSTLAEIPRAVELFARHGVPRYLLSVDQALLPEAEALGESLGLERFRRPWQTLVLECGEESDEVVPPSGITLRLAGADDAPHVGQLFCHAFDVPHSGAAFFTSAIGRPRWRVVVAESIDGRIAGAGLLFMDGAHGCLAGGATAPGFRRRGIQRAVVNERVRLAKTLGARWIGSETGIAVAGEPNPSWHNLVDAGLRPLDVCEHLVPRGASW